jgi:Na+-driven multidrug efflux pump
MSKSNAKFLTSAPMRHVAVMSATASIGLMAMFVVDFVDMIFISMLGNAALAAAIGYAGSILFFTTSFGIGIAIAAGALVASACPIQGVTCIVLWCGAGGHLCGRRLV